MENYGLDQKIDGMNVVAYISAQLERIEKAEVNLEKEKIKNSYLKQLNNHSRLRLLHLPLFKGLVRHIPRKVLKPIY